jgi:hypothetical protein
MQSMVQANQTSNALVWVGRVMSGLVIAFMLLDGAMKLVPLDVVVTTSEQMGIPGSLARPLGIIGLVCTLLYAFPRTSVLGGAIASHFRLNDPIFTHTLFGLYLGLLAWGGLYLRDARLRALIPLQIS